MTTQQAINNYLKYTGHKSLDIQVALIDCDGVLYDSMKNHTRAWVKLMQKNGIKCTRDEFYPLSKPCCDAPLMVMRPLSTMSE